MFRDHFRHPQSNTHNSSRGARVVVVDDARTQAAMLRQLLQQNGYEVFCAFDGQEGLQVVAEVQPDIVIADIVMPVLDGYAMCQALKDDPLTAQTPVILLTSLQDATDIMCGLQVGADYYLTKPYQPDYLLSTIADVLSRSGGILQSENAPEVEVEVQGQHYIIRASRQQMLSLLLSTYGSAVQQNQVLRQAQLELYELNGKLLAQQQQIEAQQRELREINARLLDQATRDPLTGLRNRRAMVERFREEADRARRRNEPLSLALLDVDHFKVFNDTFGHPAGDGVLQQVARLLESCARSSDIVARYGGEEFVLVLPSTDITSAREVGERVLSLIANAPWSARPITVSVGLATLTPQELTAHGQMMVEKNAPRQPTHIEEETNELTVLLARADAALYASKRQGRNCCTHDQNLPRS